MNDLYFRLQKIGFRVNSTQKKSKEYVDIERTIVDALYEVDNDSRLLSLVFSWVEIHGLHLVADKFIKYYQLGVEYRGECPWVIALAARMMDMKDHRFKKLLIPFKNEVWIGGVPQKTALKMDGAVDYLISLNIKIPKGHLRIRLEDILSKEQLIKLNPQYANRFRYGANWRSEIITVIERGFDTPYRIAKELNISPSRVTLVFNEYKLIA